MKSSISLMLAAVLVLGFCAIGCETSHTESNSEDWFGGRTHKETTVKENPITGDTTIKHEEQRTRP